jgi:hypothetical protein
VVREGSTIRILKGTSLVRDLRQGGMLTDVILDIVIKGQYRFKSRVLVIRKLILDPCDSSLVN